MATMPNALGMQVPAGTSTALGVGAGGTPNGAVPVNNPAAPTSVGQSPMMAAQNNMYASPMQVDGGQVVGQQAAPGAIPTTNPTGIQSTGVNWADGSNTVTGDFKDTYGAGTGTAITNVLQNMGTVNDSAIQALIAQTDTAANNQYGNIQAQQAAAGITPNSSAAALAAGDFYSQVNQGLQTNIGQMESQQQNTLLQTLLGEGSAHGGDPSLFDSILGGFNDAASIATDVGSIASFGQIKPAGGGSVGVSSSDAGALGADMG